MALPFRLGRTAAAVRRRLRRRPQLRPAVRVRQLRAFALRQHLVQPRQRARSAGPVAAHDAEPGRVRPCRRPQHGHPRDTLARLARPHGVRRRPASGPTGGGVSGHFNLLDYATRVAVRSRGWLSNLPHDRCDELLREAQALRLLAGQRLFASGERAEGVWLCATGYVRLSRASGGRRRTLAYASEGDVVGAPGFFLGTQECDADVHADATLLFLGRAQLQRRLTEWPALSQAMLTVLAQQVRGLGEEVCDARYLPLDALMAKRLAELWLQHGQTIRPGAPANRIKLAMAQAELGELIGYSRQHVNASLKRLERQGLIAVTACGIVVHD
ncbi:MAG: Crp/Fnr family transcriptional regulator, partial [Lysobacteraceae bacterium]